MANENSATSLDVEIASYEPQIYNNYGQYIHSYVGCNDNSIEGVVRGNIGMPDLNTGNDYIQGKVISLLKECIDCGVDGFRFDAAKHIETPSDGNYSSNFWSNVIGTAKSYAKSTKNIDLYNYGEILNTVGNGRSFSSYTGILNVTDNKTGDAVTAQIKYGNASLASSSYYYSEQNPNKLVLWAESHDTYMGESGSAGIKNTSGVSTDIINKSWAIVGSRAKATALYFARPGASMGDVGSMNWKDSSVANVNKFHNKFVGAEEYLSYNNSVIINERYFTKGGTDGGAVLVNASGNSTSISGVKVNTLGDGKYIDQITQNEFIVSGGNISGQIGSTGIAVVYSNNVKPENTISIAGGTFTNNITITVGLKNATSGTYKIGNGEIKTYNTSTSFKIGDDMGFDESKNILLTATDGKSTTSVSYSFTKVDPSKLNILYFDASPCSWFGSASAVATAKFDNSTEYTKMQTFTNASGKTLYYISIPSGATKVTIAREVSDGSVYNPFTTSLVSGQTLLTSNSDWNNGGSWSTYSGSKPQEETTSVQNTTEETTILETTSQQETTAISSSKLIYFDPSACTWFGNDSAAAVIKVDGGNYNNMSKFTNASGKTLYYYKVSNLASKITIARKIASGSIYNEYTVNLAANSDLYTSNSNWSNGGNWSVYTGSKPDGEEETTIAETTTTPETTTQETTTQETTTQEITTQEETTAVSNTIKVYFSNNKNWSNVYVYYWGSSSKTVTWPGEKMTFVKNNEYNEGVYSIELPKDVKGMIFTNNSGTQTVDVTTITDGYGYYISGNSGSKLSVGSYKYN